MASFTKEANPRLAKRPFIFNGRLANHANRGLTSLVKEAIERPSMDHMHYKILWCSSLFANSSYVTYRVQNDVHAHSAYCIYPINYWIKRLCLSRLFCIHQYSVFHFQSILQRTDSSNLAFTECFLMLPYPILDRGKGSLLDCEPIIIRHVDHQRDWNSCDLTRELMNIGIYNALCIPIITWLIEHLYFVISDKVCNKTIQILHS